MSYNNLDFIRGVKTLVPDAAFTVRDGDIATLEWFGPEGKRPTDAEIIAAIEGTKYIEQRATAYPAIADQLDTLYHGGYDAWRAQIQAVKDAYPKGGSQ